MKRILLVTTALLFFCFVAQAQKEAANWVFGKNVWLNFSTGSPVLVNGSLMNASYEGCASVSDAAGNLLLYTEGRKVWGVNGGVHSQMPNGSGLLGDSSATQSSVIVPNPALSHIYYIFTVDSKYGSNGLRVSTVNMNLNGGSGDVVTSPSGVHETAKNTLLLNSRAEKIAAVSKCNADSIWVVGFNYSTKKYHSFLVTGTGVSATPVISNSAITYPSNTGEIGQLKFNTTGNKVAAAFFDAGKIEMLDFNFSTGQLSNPVVYLSINGGMSVYGLSFSPNSQYLYYSVLRNQGNGLYQINLNSGLQQTIYLSADASFETSSLQLATDGKIYVALDSVSTASATNVFEGTFLGIIQNPDSSAATCNFDTFGLLLPYPLRTYRGLPNFIESYSTPKGNFSYSTTCGNDTARFYTIAYTTYDSVKWNFGEPASGVANTSAVVNASHIYTSTGNYTVSLIIYNDCFSDTIIKTVNILPSSTINLGADTAYCGAFSRVLTTGNAATVWSTGATAAQITVNSGGTYWANLNTGCGTAVDSITISNTGAVVAVQANQTVFCASDSAQVCATTGFANYLWNTGATNSCITTNLAGNYYVTATDANGCSAVSNHLAITVYPLPPVSISVNGDTLLAYNAVTYQWYLNGNPISGATSGLYIVNEAGSYSVVVTDANGCEATSNPILITGVETIRNPKSEFRITPNPFTGEISITTTGTGAAIQLTDVTGRVVAAVQPLTANCQLSTAALARGVYYLQITTVNGERIVRQMVKQ